MPVSSKLKKQRKLHLVQNASISRKIVNNATKQTRKLQNDPISAIDRPTSDEPSTYKNRSRVGPSCQKLLNFLEQQNRNVDEDTNDYYQIIHNSFLLELMKQSICISCKSTWNGVISVTKLEGTVYVVFSRVKLNNYTYILGLYCSLVFTCHCSNEIRINTFRQRPKTCKRDINVRSVVGKFIPGHIVTHKLT